MSDKKKIAIPKGYLVRVVSWENDGDNYNTQEIQGIPTLGQALAIVGFCKLFSSHCNSGGIGNLCDGETDEIGSTVLEYAKENPALDDYLKGLDYDSPFDTDSYMEGVARDLGLCGGEGFLTRVCENVECLYFPSDVIAWEIKVN